MTAKFFWERVLGQVLSNVLGWHYHKKSPNSISGDFKHDVSDCKYDTKAWWWSLSPFITHATASTTAFSAIDT